MTCHRLSMWCVGLVVSVVVRLYRRGLRSATCSRSVLSSSHPDHDVPAPLSGALGGSPGGQKSPPGRNQGRVTTTTCLCNGLCGGSMAWTGRKAFAPPSNLLAAHRVTASIWSPLAGNQTATVCAPPIPPPTSHRRGPVCRWGTRLGKSLRHILGGAYPDVVKTGRPPIPTPLKVMRGETRKDRLRADDPHGTTRNATTSAWSYGARAKGVRRHRRRARGAQPREHRRQHRDRRPVPCHRPRERRGGAVAEGWARQDWRSRRSDPKSGGTGPRGRRGDVSPSLCAVGSRSDVARTPAESRVRRSDDL